MSENNTAVVNSYRVPAEVGEPIAVPVRDKKPTQITPTVVQLFQERSQLTQILYQTLVQFATRHQLEESKGIPASDAELLHTLSSATALLTSINVGDKQRAWQTIYDIAFMGLQLTADNSSQTGNSKL
jgi:hypothetical protein